MAYHHQYSTSATFVPGGMDDYYAPPAPPELMAPKPERCASLTYTTRQTSMC